jgi:ABC-2 type transport system ATP-binding protein
LAIIETNELTKRFGDLTAVDHLTVSVTEGEIFGLLGPNGAGKTTVIKILTTLLTPNSGTACVTGFDVVRRSRDVRLNIGYVPQLISADGNLTGYENLDVFAKLYDIPGKERKKRITEAFAFMGLEDYANKLVKTYSGGMIRRLEIAQSMLHRPRVLFLDEPTIGLDPLARHSVWEHVKQLESEFGMTILLTTHLMEEAESLCRKVAIMDHGKLVALGSPDELKKAIGNEDATMDDVFIHYTGSTLESGGGTFRDISRMRRTAKRLG